MDAIAVFDQEGKFIRSFGKEFHGGGHGLAIRKEGKEEFLYLCDIKNRKVAKVSLDGHIVWSLGAPQEAGVYEHGAPYVPTNVAFAPDGGFYVGDGYGSSYIHQYDKDAKWVRTWGGAGSEPGKLRCPHGLWWDDRPGRTPSLVVADRANSRLQYFTPDGKHISFTPGLPHPCYFSIRGDVLLVPDLHSRVSLLDRDNRPIVHLGYDEAWTAARPAGGAPRQAANLAAGPVRPPAPCGVRCRRQYLRRRVGADRPDYALAATRRCNENISTNFAKFVL